MDETPSLHSWAPRASKVRTLFFPWLDDSTVRPCLGPSMHTLRSLRESPRTNDSLQRSHTQMSTEHQQARRDHLDQWIRDTDRAATPPLPHPHFGFDTQTSSSSTTRLQNNARRSHDLRRPSNPAHPPRQMSRTPAENMSQRDHVEVIDLTEPRETEANGTLGRNHEIEDDVVSNGEWERIFMAIQDEEEEEEEQTRTERPPTPPARRGPRFGRDIIDLSEDTTPPHQEPADPNRSPEVEFVRARQRTPPPPAPDPPQVVDITDIPDQGDDEDDIQFIREAPRPPREGLADYLEPEMRRPFTNFPFLWGGMAGGMARAQTYFGAQLGRTRANMDFVQRHVTNPTLQRILAPGIRTLPPPRMHMPINLNYATPAFNIGISPATSERGESPMPVPDELPEGVHSAPSKDLELVCPHCGDLLGEGDTEDKRQVWAVKACGHVSTHSSLICLISDLY